MGSVAPLVPSTGSEGLFSVKGKVALVTGASSGLGVHFAQLLAKEGANVVVAARRGDKLAEVVKGVEALRAVSPATGSVVAISLDVSGGEAAVTEAVEKAWNAFGRIDILVNNAGVFRAGSAVETSEADWDAMFGINVKGLWLVAKAVASKQAADGKGGSIINISSCVGNPGGVSPGTSGYTTTKAAVQQLTRNLALELGPSGIRVNSISPGLFPSEMTQDFIEKVQPFFTTQSPIRRVGDSAHDLAGPLLLLASNAGAYITGANLTVDGGLSILSKTFF